MYGVPPLHQDLFVSLNGGNISRLDRNGNSLATFGGVGTGPGQFQNNKDVDIYGRTLYVADRLNNRVQVRQHTCLTHERWPFTVHNEPPRLVRPVSSICQMWDITTTIPTYSKSFGVSASEGYVFSGPSVVGVNPNTGYVYIVDAQGVTRWSSCGEEPGVAASSCDVGSGPPKSLDFYSHPSSLHQGPSWEISTPPQANTSPTP